MKNTTLALSFLAGGMVLALASLALAAPVLLLPSLAWTVFGVLVAAKK